MVPELGDIPLTARALTTLGDQTTQALINLYHQEQITMFPAEESDDFSHLSEAVLRGGWSDEQAAELLQYYGMVRSEGREVKLGTLARWVLAHPNDAEAVMDCLRVDPPDEIDIIRVLSRRGSQKLVFLASWRLQQREVVLKSFLTVGGIDREMQSHPLSISHPNIIETHKLQNRHGEQFLVERRLPIVLDDEWRSGGVHEAANLLADIAQALRHLHDRSLVHGDVKPDNIGKEGDNYVLLDFGICRLIEEYTLGASATGSIRTRAPELLSQPISSPPEEFDPTKCDVWALGATVFNSVVGRFPLITSGEAIPRVSAPLERTAFEKVLADRAKDQWDSWVVMDNIPEGLRDLIGSCLVRDPEVRIGSADLVSRVKKELSAFLRSREVPDDAHGRFSPMEAFYQIRQYLGVVKDVNIIPESRKQKLESRLTALKDMPGFSDTERAQLQELVEFVSTDAE